MAKHEVVRDKAVELFAAMGFKMADRWDDGELMKKVRKIVDIVPDEGFDPEPGLADVYLGLTEALGAGKDIELVDGPEDPVEQLDDDEAEIGGDVEEGVSKEDGADRSDAVVAAEEDKPLAAPGVVDPADPEPSGKREKPAKKKSKAKKAKPPQKINPKKQKRAGPKIDGDPVHIRSIRNRLFCAGQVIQEKGLEHGLSDELIEAVDEKFGKDSKVAAKNCLWSAWHALNGYLNG